MFLSPTRGCLAFDVPLPIVPIPKSAHGIQIKPRKKPVPSPGCHRGQFTLIAKSQVSQPEPNILDAKDIALPFNRSKAYSKTCSDNKSLFTAHNLKRKPLSGVSSTTPCAAYDGSRAGYTIPRATSWRQKFPQKFDPKRLDQSFRGDPGKREAWQSQKEALKNKFQHAGWLPRKRLSPDALEGIRAIHAQYPDKYTTPVLAEKFKVSPEAIRRILKSKWRPDEEEEKQRQERWDSRGERIWNQMADMGLHPPKKWRRLVTQTLKG